MSAEMPNPAESPCPVCGSEAPAASAEEPCPSCGCRSWFTGRHDGPALFVRPNRDLVKPEPLDRLFSAVPPEPGSTYVLDLSDVGYISSEALGRLISLRKKLLAARGRLILEHVHPDVMEVFKVTRMAQFFGLEG